jgi:CcmD family protein
VEATSGVASLVVEMESADLGTNLGFLFTIFAVTWAGFFAYIFVISRRQRDLQRTVSTLTALSDKADVRDKQ